MTQLEAARSTLLSELRAHALVIGEVTLSSGQRASYYVDARRALLRPAGFRAAGELLAIGGAGAGRRCRRGSRDGGDPARLRGDRGARRRGIGRLLRPQRSQAARPPALDRGARGGGCALPGGRGHGDHRALDGVGDRADARGGPRGGGGRLRGRSPRRAAARRSPRRPRPRSGRWSRSTSSTPTVPTGIASPIRVAPPGRRPAPGACASSSRPSRGPSPTWLCRAFSTIATV